MVDCLDRIIRPAGRESYSCQSPVTCYSVSLLMNEQGEIGNTGGEYPVNLCEIQNITKTSLEKRQLIFCGERCQGGDNAEGI